MKSSRLALFALALAAIPGAAFAEDPARSYTTFEQVVAISNPTLNYRYIKPDAVGEMNERIPASALATIPPNILHYGHEYGLGEASLHISCAEACEDAKGRATYDRHWRYHHRAAWVRHYNYE